MYENVSIEAVLDCPMNPNDADAATVRDYLKALLGLVWAECEGFDGKRPFGNSGWTNDVTDSLVAAGLAAESEADALVAEAIRGM